MQSYGLGGLNTVQNMSDRNMMETLMANGGQRFALGGLSSLGGDKSNVSTFTFDPITGQYTQIDGATAASSGAPKYTYDPITQKYTLVTDKNPINNAFAKNGSGSDGGPDVPVDPRTAAFLEGVYSNMSDLISADIAGVNLASIPFGNDLINLGTGINLQDIATFGMPSNLF